MKGALKGRKLWFVGIGGAGLSAYARLAQAWGAEVGGWDRVETPYLRALEGVRKAAFGAANLVPPILQAVHAYATVGEIMDTLRDVFGEYRDPGYF